MKKNLLFLLFAISSCILSCKKEQSFERDLSMGIKEPPQGRVTTRYKGLMLRSEISDDLAGATYEWLVDGAPVSTEKDLYFVSSTEGAHEVVLNVKKGEQIVSHTITIQVNKEAAPYSTLLAKVYDYTPAPGQFVNTMPVYDIGESVAAVTKRAENALKNESTVHLGGFGGYIIAGFDHTVMNTPGTSVVKVAGNAFYNWSEPGIIMVSYDANMNGQPDDEWYEIAGSAHSHPKTIRNYEITYYKPDENKVKTPSKNNLFLIDTTYIRWTDNQGGASFLSKNVFHGQSYYPQWKGASITFTGTKLPDEQIVDQSGTGNYFVSPPFDYGYADNWGNTDAAATIKLDWAIDKNGNPVKLTGIDFIKVYTGLRKELGWLGEISTEIVTIKDLNLK